MLGSLAQGISRSGISVVRSLLDVSVASTTFGAEVEWQLGMMVIEQDAFDAGAVPELNVDILNYYLHDGGIYNTDSDAGPRFKDLKYDIRTARKIPSQRHTLVFLMQNTGGASLTFFVTSRVLIRLP